MDLPKLACHSFGMNGEQIRAAREARGWTQPQLATALGVGARSIGNWENGHTIPRNRIGMLREVLNIRDDDSVANDPIRAASDVTLLAELLRRASARQSATG